MRSSRVDVTMAGLAALLAVLVAAVAAARTAGPVEYWPDVRDFGAVRAFSASDLLADAQTAIIWQPHESDTPLVYQPVEKNSTAVGILPYTDLSPVRWQTVPAGADRFHIVWLEQDARLRSALITTTGETIRGPITLTARTSHFAVVPFSGERASVLWINDSAGQLASAVIDANGRPGPTTTSPAIRLDRLAARADQEEVLHVAWLTPSAPHTWTLYYQNAAAPLLDAPVVLHSLALSAEETLLSFDLGLDHTHGYVTWSVASTRQPDAERIFVLAFPLDQPVAGRAAELRLPDDFAPMTGIPGSDLAVGSVDTTIPGDDAAALRWPQPAPGDHTVLPIAVAVHTTDGWRPAVAYFKNGRRVGFQVAAHFPADAGPVSVSVDQAGSLHLAWTGLNDAVPHLYTASSGAQGIPSSPDSASSRWLHAAAGLIAGLPLGLLWLVLPTALIVLAPVKSWAFPLALGLYTAAKLLWPPALYSHVPPPLIAAGLDHLSPAVTVGAAALVIGLLASAALLAARRTGRPPLYTWIIFAALDVALTWFIFGANVIG